MTEGTKSWLFGCHSITHSILVIKAWKHIYKVYPKLWQIICIFLHDIGYCGTNYITDKTNKQHALMGAVIAKKLFGQKGYDFCIGHSMSYCIEHGLPLSKLEAPDDYSWIIAPHWFLKLNTIIEPQLHHERWRQAVKDNWAKGINNRIAGFELAKQLWNNEI